MTRPTQVLEQVRRAMGGHEKWLGRLPHLVEYPGRVWRIPCGEGRFEPSKRNAVFSLRKNIALNFQILGQEDHISSFEICVAWPPLGPAQAAPWVSGAAYWSLMYHWDPSQESWPSHPLYHLQFSCPEPPSPPPFAGWRLPFNETAPDRLIEFVTHHTT